MPIKKAVFPVAGLGSRFLPATKATPKEMLPVVDKPLIQYAVEEAARAGFNHMIFITSSTKRAIEDHFDKQFELESRLLEQRKESFLELVRNVSPEGIQFTYVRQNQPLGLGHAILCAEHVIGEDPFSILLADDLIDDLRVPCLSSMVDFFMNERKSILAVQSVPWHDVHQYGVVSLVNTQERFSEVTGMIEKPAAKTAPSNLAAVGRYIFTPAIFAALRETPPDERGEIQLTDGIKRLLDCEKVLAFQFDGKRYDCGSKLGYMQASVEFGLRHPEIGESFHQFLEEITAV
ncbi:glucose-1-phosphate uridylyltransferase [Legionella quinlivanii]|uniref:UTP--glucose-1-phosphate uridylyltransferase n=1 Tax=Legionella quinlivanii TaxID=45073 RepID=A0A0W0Y545_9GAMM|nr:UTP--glucose-1-phosphate uridylyltransferase GalU [Legionella quinlivanii]KTD51791.1 glucose-1-phosphate uridylyltransferase [Legionella quinlivanii]SEF66473.1 UTP--glucose-1-phosphate uridylyltransferase [Legionella quinlivanii DSM 21216]STY10681.1 glucose-1-phosphate uridylyltransferase [Legionella quinlivanii]